MLWLILFGTLLGVSPEGVKLDISTLEHKIFISSSGLEKRTDLKVELAIAYLRDQNQEKAFALFLEALNETKPKDPPSISSDEKLLYEAALEKYIDHQTPPSEMAKTLLYDYSQTLKEHPDHVLLNFLISLSYANLGQFSDFFSQFYRSYPYYTDHYLAYKTKAMLHIKLFERSRTAEERESHRLEIVKNIGLALDKYPLDSGLYRPAIAFSVSTEKSGAVKNYLKKILDNHIVIPRADLIYYVQEAVASDQTALAQDIINAAREWYPYSRLINAAQQYVDQHKTR